MNADFFVLTFPVIPIIGAVLMLLTHYATGRDWSKAILFLVMMLMIAVGALILYEVWVKGYGNTFSLSPWRYSILFKIDAERAFFLLAFITPAVLGIFFIDLLESLYIRVIFAFYLAGCATIIVTGDVFTFFVAYEMMIMSAYVLVTVRQRYYAGIKYMIIGSVSSAFLLAGVILLYASVGSFGFDFVDSLSTFPAGNTKFLMLLFSMAFFVKGAFFPVCSWAPTCHSATNPLVSAFLSSFTIFTGIFGLVFLVLEPSMNLGYTAIFTFLRILSVLTVFMSGLFVFFEPELKRCVAGSTVFSIGFIGILLSYGMTTEALSYMVIHSVYKSCMFLLVDRVDFDGIKICGKMSTLALFFVTIFFTAGFFPSFIYFLKYSFIEQNPLYRLLVYVSMFLVFGGFFKFKFRTEAACSQKKINPLFYLVTISLFLLHGLYFPFYKIPDWYGFIFDIIFVLAAFTLSACIYRKLAVLQAFDTRFIFRNMNVELLLVAMLFFIEIAFLRYVMPL